MRSLALVLVLLVPALVLGAGCGDSLGNGRWDLAVGGQARLISPDGSDVVLQTLAAPSKARTGRQVRLTLTTKVETATVPAGTAVEVLAIDGDDARIRIKDGRRVGLTTWVECARLEPVAR